MSEFWIELSPPLPKPHQRHSEIQLERLDFARILKLYPEEIDIRYFIDGRMFCYYPSSILTALNDIHLEVDLIKSKSSHDMTLSGYTVLQMVFDADRAIFYDPVEQPLTEVGGVMLGTCAVVDLEATFQEALDALWESIQSRISS